MKKAIKLFILIIAVTFPMQTNAFKGNYESSVGLPLQLNTTLEFNFNHMNYSLLSEFVTPNLALKEFNTTHLDFYNNIYSKIGSMELTSKSIEKFKLEINNLYISDSNLYIEYESDIEDFKKAIKKAEKKAASASKAVEKAVKAKVKKVEKKVTPAKKAVKKAAKKVAGKK